MAVIGIDLGTTNSLVAYWTDGESRLIPCDRGKELLPSAVSVTEDGKYIIGSEAKARLYTEAESTAASFKRFMGTEKEYLLADRNLKALELSALVLQHIREEAERFLKEPIEEAIITVPAYFNDRQRSDTKKAASLAGLHVERLINEPSAAALAYRNLLKEQSGDEDCNMIVFDFGGGTLDLSYVECFENIIEIVAVAGDNRLGGDDIDRLIAEYYCVQNEVELDLLSPNDYAELIKCAERAKIGLGEDHTVNMAAGFGERVSLDGDTLFQICMPLFDKIKKLFLRLLKDADIRISEIDALVMVGGSSGLVVVQRFLTELLGKRPVLPAEADKVVAVGAGVYAGIRERNEEIKDLMLTDVCPFTLGMESGKEHQLVPIIPRNTTLPAHRVEHFVTLNDFQKIIAVNVYQGEEYYAKDNLFLGGFHIPVPTERAGMEGIEVHFTYDVNGILHVEAYNSKREHKDLLIANQNLSEEELRKYQEIMADIELHPMEQSENKALLEELMELYEGLVGAQKHSIGNVIDQYLQVLNLGRRAQILRVRERIKSLLADDTFSDEWQEELRFDGERKFLFEGEEWEEDGYETDSEDSRDENE